MKTIARLCLLTAPLLLSACDAGPFANADAMRKQAQQSLEQKNFGEAAGKAEALSRKAPDDYNAYFLLAQAQAQLGNKNAALAALEAAIKKGFKDDQAIAANANLEPLRNMSAYQELIAAAFPRSVQPLNADNGNPVGISENAEKTVIRAGDVSIEVPKN